MDRAVFSTARRWLAEGRAAVLVEVLQALGSSPRETGTRMLVATNDTAGTVGGGHLELKAIALARDLLTRCPAEGGTRVEHFALGPALGQCCGGAMTLGFSALSAQQLAAWPQAEPRFHLQLYGAGHVGRAIATLLATLDVTVDWIDEREQEFPTLTTLGSAWPAHIRQLCVDSVEREVARAPAGAFYLVLTHDHALDLRITEAVLRRADFGYLGLIGSKTKRQRFVHRFEHRGLPAESIARMSCPIGVGPIVGKQPEVIAIAVLAQLLQQSEATTAPPARKVSATTP